MNTLLLVDSSPRPQRSCSRRLSAHFVEAWRKAHPNGQVMHRDLSLAPLPMVTEDWIAAAVTAPAERTAEQQAAIAVSDALIDEMLGAGTIVIAAPMYNFGIPAALKAWIDQVVRIGRTVAPTYRGLLQGKQAVILATRGLGYGAGEAQEHDDAQVPYLRRILQFMGISEIAAICADHMTGPDALREQSIQRALMAVEEAARR
ncbi:MAG: NAD(P)H-dependent oxidoreductase [Acidobacteria bacterium]|nr:NAD(P)H-dependent oxidoreductase [Acidobacteriota bacterium]